jgi:hypothetical protein
MRYELNSYVYYLGEIRTLNRGRERERGGERGGGRERGG